MERLQRVENALKQRTLETFRAALRDVDTRDLLTVRVGIERRYARQSRKGKTFGEAITAEVQRRRIP